mgnify:CR=1 FL=1
MTTEQTLKLALEALKKADAVIYSEYCGTNCEELQICEPAIKALEEALKQEQAEKQKLVSIKKVAEERGINLPTEFVPKRDESKAAIQSLTDQCAALIRERDELQKQVWRYEKNGIGVRHE